MNIFGEQIPPAQPDAKIVSFGGSNYSVIPSNYGAVAEKYFQYQKSKFPGTINDGDRQTYLDAFRQLAGEPPQNYTLDENGAAVPNNQGWGYYLQQTIGGGVSGSIDKLNRDIIPKLPDTLEIRTIIYGALGILLFSVYLRSKGK